jgi:hypothetical protein
MTFPFVRAEAINVLLSDPVQFRLNFDADDLPERILGREQQCSSLSRAEIDEGEVTEIGWNVRDHVVKLDRIGRLIETLGKEFADSDAERETGPGGVNAVVEVVVDVAEAGATPIGKAVADEETELLGEIPGSSPEATVLQGIPQPLKKGAAQAKRLRF